jgi:hypothetical protein
VQQAKPTKLLRAAHHFLIFLALGTGDSAFRGPKEISFNFVYEAQSSRQYPKRCQVVSCLRGYDRLDEAGASSHGYVFIFPTRELARTFIQCQPSLHAKPSAGGRQDY